MFAASKLLQRKVTICLKIIENTKLEQGLEDFLESN